jgi:hypothetical protein
VAQRRVARDGVDFRHVRAGAGERRKALLQVSFASDALHADLPWFRGDLLELDPAI